MIKKLSLTNFKRHPSLTLEFDNGLVSIIGPNAKGKSTVLKAILFAMFGATATGSNKEHLKTWGADGAMSVAMTLDLPGRADVTITRSEKNAKAVSADGKLLANSHSAVTAFVEECLGMSAKDLQLLMYSKQGDTQQILEMGGAELQRRIESLSNMAVLDKVLELLGKDITLMEGKLSGLPDTTCLPALRAELDVKQREVEQMAVSVGILDLDWRRLSEEVANSTVSLKEAERIDAEIVRLSNEIHIRLPEVSRLTDKYTEQMVAFRALPAVDTKEIERLQSDINFLKGDLYTLNQQKTQAVVEQARSDLYRRQLADLEGRLPAHQDAVREVAQLEERLAVLEAEKAEADVAYRTADARLGAAIRAADGTTCPTCKRPFGEHSLEDIEAEQVAAREQYAAAGRALTQCKAAVDAIQAPLKGWRARLQPGIEEAVVRARQLVEQGTEVPDVAAIEASLQAVEGAKAAAMKELQDLNALLSTSQQMEKRLNECRAELVSAQGLAEKAQNALAELPEVDVDGLKMVLAQKRDDFDKARESLFTATQQMNLLESRVEQIQTEITHLAQADKVRKDTSARLDGSNKLQEYLRKNRTRLGSGLWENLLLCSSALVSAATGGVLLALARNPSGDFTTQEAGQTVPVSELSGAQRSIVGLALRASLTRVFYGTGLPMLLDEATADCRDDLAAAVAGMLASLNCQVIAVSHRTGDVAQGSVVEL